MLSQDEIKQKLGAYAVALVPDNGIIGMGTGTTIHWLLHELGQKVAQGFRVTIVPTSRRTQEIAVNAGIAILELNAVDKLSITIDGADEIDPQLQLIKGGGGALLQEKMVAAASKRLVILADESKYVGQLGQFPLPVVVIPFGWRQVQKRIEANGCPSAKLRLSAGKPLVTDHGHFILDCKFGVIPDPASLNAWLHAIPGVVETGLFIDMANTVVIGHADGRIQPVESRPS